jgi:hypothetical protein
MNEQTEIKDGISDTPDEKAAEFAALQQMANEPAPGAPVTEPEPEQPAIPLAVQISAALGMVVNMAKPMFPSLERIYTAEVLEQVGISLQPVCDKHGWLQEGIGGKYGEELIALVVVAPLAYATYIGVRGDIDARKPRKPDAQLQSTFAPPAMEAAAPDVQPGAKTVTAGTVVPA